MTWTDRDSLNNELTRPCYDLTTDDIEFIDEIEAWGGEAAIRKLHALIEGVSETSIEFGGMLREP